MHKPVAGLRVRSPRLFSSLRRVAERRARKHAVRGKRRRVEYRAVHAEVIADAQEERFRDADIDDLEIVGVEELVAVRRLDESGQTSPLLKTATGR